METLILVARVGLSLAAVLGLLWWLGRRVQGSGALKRRRREGLVVLGRQQLGGKSGVALIEAGGRRLVVGYGEQGVSLIHDAGDVADEEAAPEAPALVQAADDQVAVPAIDELVASFSATETVMGGSFEPVVTKAHKAQPRKAAPAAQVHVRSTSARTAEARRPRTPLEGSILAPDTWRKAVVAAQEWTTRRS